MTKRLSVDHELFEGIKLLGLVTPLKDYRLAYFINNELNLKLSRYADFTFEGKEGEYAWYYFSKGNKYHNITLINNYHPHGKLVLEPKIDFLLMIKNVVAEEVVPEILAGLRKINGIPLAFLLNAAKIKNADLLLEALEMHELKEVIRPRKPK
mgnify:CR=1 FL=1